MENIQERVRSVDVERLDPDHAERIGEEIGKMIAKAGEEVAEKINKFLGIYGLKANVVVQLIEIKTGKPVGT